MTDLRHSITHTHERLSLQGTFKTAVMQEVIKIKAQDRTMSDDWWSISHLVRDCLVEFVTDLRSRHKIARWALIDGAFLIEFVIDSLSLWLSRWVRVWSKIKTQDRKMSGDWWSISHWVCVRPVEFVAGLLCLWLTWDKSARWAMADSACFCLWLASDRGARLRDKR